MTTLDLPELLKGGAHDLPALRSQRDPKPFRVPHHYQQYQQTILSRSFTTFTEPHRDKVPAICVRGAKIEGQQGSSSSSSNEDQNKQGRSEDARQQTKSPESESRIEDTFKMMNARGETNISFYDFQRTWSIEDYEVDEEEEESDGGGGGKRRPAQRRLSLTGGDNNKTNRYQQHHHHRRVVRPPSPKTKQIIRVNVVRVANS